MTNWFQTYEAFRLFSQNKHWHTEYFELGSVSCVVTIMGPFFCRRAIIQGGVTIDESKASKDDLALVLSRLIDCCRRYRCVYIELRNFADYSAYQSVFEAAGFVFCPHYDIHLPLAPQEEMMSRMHESKQRALRRLREEGYIWREAKTEEDVRAFYHNLRTLYRTKVKRPIPTYSFFLKAWQQGVKILVTEHNGRINGGVFMPVLGEVAYEWYICGSAYATWAMMEWGINHGIRTIDMVGGGRPDIPYGVRDFKVQMGGLLRPYGRFLLVLQPLIYNIGNFIIRMLK